MELPPIHWLPGTKLDSVMPSGLELDGHHSSSCHYPDHWCSCHFSSYLPTSNEIQLPNTHFLGPLSTVGRSAKSLIKNELPRSLRAPEFVDPLEGPVALSIRRTQSYLANPVFTAVIPPSTVNTAPVINEASSEARKRAALAISSGFPSLLIG